MKIVATTSLPAVDRLNAERWNAARSRQLLGSKTFWLQKNLGPSKFFSQNNGVQKFLGPNKSKTFGLNVPRSMTFDNYGPRNLTLKVKIGKVTADLLLVWTNVAWINVTKTADICFKVGPRNLILKFGQNQVSNS